MSCKVFIKLLRLCDTRIFIGLASWKVLNSFCAIWRYFCFPDEGCKGNYFFFYKKKKELSSGWFHFQLTPAHIWNLALYAASNKLYIPAFDCNSSSLFFMSVGLIALLHFVLQQCNCVMRSGKYGAVSVKRCVLCLLWHLRKPITFPSHHRLHGSDIGEKKVQYYSIIHLMPCLHSYYYPMFFTFFHSHNFSIFRFLSHSHCLRLCLSRASIVQKRVIYFQDEGSLTIRLCEKGNDSCPSSPHLRWQLLIFSSLATHHSAIVPITFPIAIFLPFGSWTVLTLPYSV